MHTSIIDPDTIEIDGTRISIPQVNKNVSFNVNITVVVDDAPFEVVQAVRLLLAQREYLQTKIADLRQELDKK